jgi:hypothetical protein
MASVDYLITTRAIKDGKFVALVGSTRYLRVPSRIAIPTPEMAAPNARDQALWVKEVRDLADGDPNQNSISIAGDILVFIHGYNNDLDVIMKRQRQLAKDLKAEGWKGVVIGFDWPSDNETLGYWEDRSRAAEVAVELVSNVFKRGIRAVRAGRQVLGIGWRKNSWRIFAVIGGNTALQSSRRSGKSIQRSIFELLRALSRANYPLLCRMNMRI